MSEDIKKKKKIHRVGYNLDKSGASRCIKAGYFKFGLGNFLYHPNDGYTAPCVIEFELEENGEEANKHDM